MLEQSHKIFLILLLLTFVLSFPMDSLIYEANAIQRVSFKYDDTNSTQPLKFKLQTVSFRIYEQLDGLNSNNEDDDERNVINEKHSKEIEEKYKKLSRFTVFYNSEDNIPNAKTTNDTNKKLQTIGTVHKNMSSIKVKKEKNNLEKENHTESSTVSIENKDETTEADIFNTDVTTEFASTDIDLNVGNEITSEVDYFNETMTTSEIPSVSTVQ